MIERYKTYKESGIEWIGEIPEDWDVIKMKWISSVKRGASPRPIADTKYFDEKGEFAWVRIADVSASERYLKYTTERLSELGSSLSVKRYPGDFFLSIAGSVGKPIITKIKCCIHDGFVWFPELEMNPEYLYYLFQSELPFLGLGKMGTQLNLNTETIGNIYIPRISKKDIDSIVNYLDDKTNSIDTIITQKEELIKKLKEQRQAIINEAVTKGLNPNVQLKDSRIEWLGDIPEHWKVVKFRYKFETSKGLTITKANLVDEGIPVVNYGEIHSKFGFEVNPEINNLKCVSEEYIETNKNALLSKGDFVFADTSEDIEGSGNFTHLNSDIPTFAGYHTIIARLIDSSDYRYFAYFFDSATYRTQIQNLVKGVKVYSITNKILKDTILLCPPVDEQKNISEHIDSKVNKIFSSIEKLEKSIEKLKEYRQSIISEAVTGKIDVRDWKPKIV